MADVSVKPRFRPIIYAWGDFGPDSVTGRWGANTYPDGAVAYIPQDLSDARVAAAYGYIADLIDVTCDLTSTAGYTDFADRMREMVPGIRDASPADATAALAAALNRARNKALEDVIEYLNKQAERYHDHFHAQKQRFDRGAFVALQEAASDICAMKEQPHD